MWKTNFPLDLLLVATKGCSGKQDLSGVPQQIQQSAPCPGRGVVCLVYKHQVEKISRWRRYYSVSWAYAGNSGNHNVILPQVFPCFIGAYCAFRCEDFGCGEVKRVALLSFSDRPER